MSEKLSKEQIRQLAAPFSLPEHEFREGGHGEYLVYITELPLITRLNDVDPAWELSIKETIILEQPDAPAVVNVFGELTICGVSRANVGTYAAKLQTTEYDPVKKQRVRLDPPRVLPLDDNATKAAATDLLKRCARSFGCGGYLLAAPRLKADSEDAAKTMFARWYKQAFPVADQSRRIQTGPVQAPPEPPDDEQQVQPLKPSEVDALIEYARELRPDLADAPRAHLSNSCLKSCGLADWTDPMPGGLDAAKAAVEARALAKAQEVPDEAARKPAKK
jgi:hypothetical protein